MLQFPGEYLMRMLAYTNCLGLAHIVIISKAKNIL